MFALVFACVALGTAAVHVLISPPQSRVTGLETLLAYWFSIAIGLTGVFEFAGHTFLADRVAASIGWPAGNPFQQEVAFADLALGVLGILCVWIRGNFWVATAVAATTMLWGDALGHVMQTVRHANYHAGNAGIILWTDVLIPAVTVSLLVYRSRSQSTNRT